MGKSSSPPPPPDPRQTAAAQTQQNRDTAAFNAAINRGNTYTPWGSQEYTPGGVDPRTGAPLWNQTITLDPVQQAILDQQNQQALRRAESSNTLLDTAVDSLGNPIDTSGLPQRSTGVTVNQPLQYGYDYGQARTDLNTSGLPGLETDAAALRDRAEGAIYDRNTQYLDRRFGRAREQEASRLANQGIVEGSEAWNNAMRDLNEREDTVYQQARNDAIIGGGAEASRLFDISSRARGQTFGEELAGGQFYNQGIGQNYGQEAGAAGFSNATQGQEFGQGVTNANFQNQARDRGLDELFSLRTQPLNEYSALLGNYQVNTPNFGSAPQVGTNPADIAGLIQNQYQGRLDAYNAKQQGKNAITGAIGSLGAAALSNPWIFAASDERVKEDIEQIGELNDGTGLFSFRYIGDPTPQVGVMAQEIEKKDPSAVKEFDGIKHVSYSKVLANALRAA